MKVNPLSLILGIAGALALLLIGFITDNVIGFACAVSPKTFGGPLPDNSAVRHAVYGVSGGLATVVLFWNNIKPIASTIISSILGRGAVPPVPGTNPADVIGSLGGLGDITSILGSLIGGDARLAPVKLVVDYLLKIPQVLSILDGIRTYGWPSWWYISVCWPNRIETAAAGTLPTPLPMPSAPPVVHIAAPPPVIVPNPPPAPVVVIPAPVPAGPVVVQ